MWIFWKERPKLFVSQAGATLIEAMLCVMILAVCLVPVIQAMLSGLRATSEVEGYTRAILAGENAMFAFLQKEFYSGSAETKTTYEDQGCQVSLSSGKLSTVTLKKIDDEQIREAKIEIKWKLGKKEKRMVLSTLLIGKKEQEK